MEPPPFARSAPAATSCMPPHHSPPSPALVVLAAGLSTRYDRLKQLDPVGPEGQALMDYTIADAVDAGVRRVVLVVREEIEAEVRSHVQGQLTRRGRAGQVHVVTALQRLDDLPGGRTPPPGRTRPWGTAHALHAARHSLEGVPSFLLANADDGYGRDAIRRLVAWAAAAPAPASSAHHEFALVPFQLEATLSDHGGVSRGIVEVDDEGLLSGIREAVQIRRAHGGATGVLSTADDQNGTEARLELDAPVSLNLWGFTARMLELVAEGLTPFLDRAGLDGAAHGAAQVPPLDAEYYLPEVVREAVAEGRVRVRVLAPATTHLGMTHPEDRAPVVAALAEGRLR